MTEPQEFALSDTRIFDGERFHEGYSVIVRGDRIHAVVPATQLDPALPCTRLGGGTLAPGFIDLQVNGGGGVLLSGEPTAAAVATMVDAHRASGTTTMTPTLVSSLPETLRAGVAAVAAAVASGNPGVLGVHIEGPFLDRERRGAHRSDYIRGLEAADRDWLCQLQPLRVILTLAPEHVSVADIAALSSAGIRVCAGHSNARYEEVERAVRAGLSGFTHLYNAMRPLNAREPGVVGAALAHDECWVGIIADGHHVHTAAIRVAHAAKPTGKLYLVSDAMATVGAVDKRFTLYGEEILEIDGRLVNAEGKLAGSAIGMIDAVRHAVDAVGIPLAESLRMASLYPAEFLGVADELGRIQSGYRADLVHFDAAYCVDQTWVAGAPRRAR